MDAEKDFAEEWAKFTPEEKTIFRRVARQMLDDLPKENKIDNAIDKTKEVVKDVTTEIKTSQYVQHGVEQGRSLIQVLFVMGIVLGIGIFILYLLDDKPRPTQIIDPNAPTPITNYAPNTYYPTQSKSQNKSESTYQTNAESAQQGQQSEEYIYNGPYLYRTTISFPDVLLRAAPNINGVEIYHCIQNEPAYVLETNCADCGNYNKVYIRSHTGYIAKQFLAKESL